MELRTFDDSLQTSGLFPLASTAIKTLQMNLGLRCNQSCKHCHVEAGPDRTEIMSADVMEASIALLDNCDIEFVDLTGGAPEMHPDYRWLVEKIFEKGVRIKTRTNLTVLLEEGFTDLPAFFAARNVDVFASLPFYLEGAADRVRGRGVFTKSIEALKELNRVGYGSALALNLVYNPAGAFFPPEQRAIEADFRRELLKRYGITFTNLYTLTNMPIGRFKDFLVRSNNYETYMERLAASYNPIAAAKVMCRETLSVGWDGSIYDCDFNQMLGLKCNHGAPDHIDDFDLELLETRRIVTAPHCYGCTAGAGSSCGGAVAVE